LYVTKLSRYEAGERRVVVPRHHPLRGGTLSAILRDVEQHFQLTKEELISRLMGQGSD
jgi:hypothetical protein